VRFEPVQGAAHRAITETGICDQLIQRRKALPTLAMGPIREHQQHAFGRPRDVGLFQRPVQQLVPHTPLRPPVW